jgi:hypothetical protein
MTRTSQLALAATAALGAFLVNDNMSLTQPSSLVSRAEARIGNPLTPGSIAGVNRRVQRRAYRRAYYGGGYYGGGYYGGGYYGYRPGLGLAASAALNTGAPSDSSAYFANSYYGYYDNPGYSAYNGAYGSAAYGSAAYGSSGDDVYILHGNYMSEADAVAYCAQRFHSYDADSRTFLARSGERVSCPQ